jgi:hypothetical protein
MCEWEEPRPVSSEAGAASTKRLTKRLFASPKPQDPRRHSCRALWGQSGAYPLLNNRRYPFLWLLVSSSGEKTRKTPFRIGPFRPKRHDGSCRPRWGSSPLVHGVNCGILFVLPSSILQFMALVARLSRTGVVNWGREATERLRPASDPQSAFPCLRSGVTCQAGLP